MTREEILTKLTPIVQEIFTDNSLVLNDAMSAENTEAWTSMSFMLLLTEIENQFSFEFKMLEILRLQTMGAIINSIEQHTT